MSCANAAPSMRTGWAAPSASRDLPVSGVRRKRSASAPSSATGSADGQVGERSQTAVQAARIASVVVRPQGSKPSTANAASSTTAFTRSGWRTANAWAKYVPYESP